MQHLFGFLVTTVSSNITSAVNLIICWLLCITLPMMARENYSIKDFKGFEFSLYNESSGDRFLKMDYHRAITERPKIGFLKFGLSFLKIENLSIYLDVRHTNSLRIAEYFQEVSNSKGVQYAIAEPISLTINSESCKVVIKADKGKFTTDGLLRLWGEVDLVRNNRSQTFKNLSISINSSSNQLEIEVKGEPNLIKIPLIL